MSSRRPKGASKSEIMTHLAEKTGLAKSQVSGVFDAFGEFVAKELRAGRPVALSISEDARAAMARARAVVDQHVEAAEGLDDVKREMAIESTMAEDALKEFEREAGLVTPETASTTMPTWSVSKIRESSSTRALG